MSASKVTIVGGGSAQWVPILVEDFANTPCLAEMTLTLEDLDERRLVATGAHARHVAEVRGLGWNVETTTDEAFAFDGADSVVVCISTGGFDSMGADLDVARRHAVPVPIGDTVGASGISRALRNIPVLVALARHMEARCPNAWLLNVTNPMTTLCRAVTRETSVRTAGLCHEVTNAMFFLSQLLECGYFDVDVTVTGVNHLPLITGVRVGGRERLDDLVALADGRADTGVALPFLDRVMSNLPIGTGGPARTPGAEDTHWTKQTVLGQQAVNYEILRRFGALPGADSDHTAEFFPGFITDASGWGERWNVRMVTIEERRRRERDYRAALEQRIASDRVPPHRSPEMVAPVIESLMTGTRCMLPLNIPNAGQCPQLPDDVVVESMCIVDADGIRGRDRACAPAALGEWLRRVSASQELTVDAALSGEPDLVLHALATDPNAGRLDHQALIALRDDILASTSQWLPQFTPP